MKFRGRVDGWLGIIGIALIALLAIAVVQWFQRETDPLKDWTMVNDAMAQALDQIQNDGQQLPPHIEEIETSEMPATQNWEQDEMEIGSGAEGSEAPMQAMVMDPQQEPDGRISINRADLQQLQQLPGIGPVKAQAIIDYRMKKGDFQTIDALMDVKGIGPKTFARLQDQITVD